MNIYLGNLSTKQIESRLAIALTDGEREIMQNSNQQNANNIAVDKWHCFDIPFVIACGSCDTACKIRDVLQPYASQMVEPIQIAVQED